MFGYPANLDKGKQLHQVNSGNGFCCVTKNGGYGSDMRKGSSGGPWVQNFGQKAKGQKGGKNKNMNRIVGVTSAASLKKSDMFLASSVPGASFNRLYDQACRQAPGNCSR